PRTWRSKRRHPRPRRDLSGDDCRVHRGSPDLSRDFQHRAHQRQHRYLRQHQTKGNGKMTLRVVVGSDDAGFEYKEVIKSDMGDDKRIASVFDVGVDSDSHTFYPSIATTAAEIVAR